MSSHSDYTESSDDSDDDYIDYHALLNVNDEKDPSNDLELMCMEQLCEEFNDKNSLINMLGKDVYTLFIHQVEKHNFPFVHVEIDLNLLTRLTSNTEDTSEKFKVICHIGRMHITATANSHNLLDLLRELDLKTSVEGVLFATVLMGRMDWPDEYDDYRGNFPNSRMRFETCKALKNRDCSFTIIPTNATKLQLIRGIILTDKSIHSSDIKFTGTHVLNVDQPFKIMLLSKYEKWKETDKGIMEIPTLKNATIMASANDISCGNKIKVI